MFLLTVTKKTTTWAFARRKKFSLRETTEYLDVCENITVTKEYRNRETLNLLANAVSSMDNIKTSWGSFNTFGEKKKYISFYFLMTRDM